MENLYNFRAYGKEIELNDGSTVILFAINKIENSQKIMARIANQGIELWSGADYTTHLEDSEEDLINRFIAVM